MTCFELFLKHVNIKVGLRCKAGIDFGLFFSVNNAIFSLEWAQF